MSVSPDSERGAIDVVDDLDDDAFAQRFLQPRRPVVWRGGAATTTPVTTWTPASLKARCGDVVVSMAELDEQEVVFGHHLDAVVAHENGAGPKPRYLRNVFLPMALPMLDDDVAIPFFAAGSLLAREPLAGLVPVEWRRWIELFVSGPGTRFPRIHADTHQTHAWLTQVVGQKRAWLWPPRRRSQRARLEDNLLTIDIDDGADLDTAMAHARPVTGTLSPGDVLFIPAGWWHTVESLSLSITLSGNFVVDENRADFAAFNALVAERADAPAVVAVARAIVQALATA